MKSLLEQVLLFEDVKKDYSTKERKKIRKSLRIKISKSPSKSSLIKTIDRFNNL